MMVNLARIDHDKHLIEVSKLAPGDCFIAGEAFMFLQAGANGMYDCVNLRDAYQQSFPGRFRVNRFQGHVSTAGI